MSHKSETSGKEASSRPEGAANIEVLKEPALRILKKLRPDIEKGVIGTLVGIDGSGRIPTLILREVIQARYAFHGYQPLETRFLRGNTSSPESSPVGRQYHPIAHDPRPDAIDAMELDPKRKVLLVDDTVALGESTRPLVRAFLEKGYSIDVVAFTLADALMSQSDMRKVYERERRIAELEKPGTAIAGNPRFIAGDRATQSPISDHPELSGVTGRDDRPEVAHGTPYKGSAHADADGRMDDHAVQQSIASARALVHEVAKELLREYSGKKD